MSAPCTASTLLCAGKACLWGSIAVGERVCHQSVPSFVLSLYGLYHFETPQRDSSRTSEKLIVHVKSTSLEDSNGVMV